MSRSQLLLLLAVMLFASRLAVSTPAQASWPSQVSVSSVPNHFEGPALPVEGVGAPLCSDLNGGMICAYTDISTGIKLNRLDEDGVRQWNGANGVFVTGATANVRVASDGGGGAWVAFRGAGNGLFVQRYDPAGAALFASGGVQVGSNVTSIGLDDIDIETAASNKLLLAFWDSSGLRVQRVTLAGAVDFTATGRLMTSDTGPHTLDLAPFGEGGVVAWSSARASLPGPAGATRIVANRFSSSGTPQWGSEGSVVQAGAGVSATGPRAIWTGSHLIVTWLHDTTPVSIHAQALDLSGVAQWGATTAGRDIMTTPNTPWDASTGSTQPVIAPDGAGGCFIAWQDFRDFNRPDQFDVSIHREDIYAQRCNSAGTALWTANGAPVDTASREQGRNGSLRVCSDGAGGAFFTFNHDNQLGLDLVATRLDANGTRLFQELVTGPNGLLQEDLDPVMIADDGGGFMLLWKHQAVNGQVNCWAAHRGSDGNGYMIDVDLLDPNGGESFRSLVPETISWMANFAASVTLEYQDGAAPPVIIASPTANDGLFTWTVPTLSSTEVRVIVSDAATGAPTDASDANFSICPTLSFPVTYAAGTTNAGSASADFNEDGIADLAICHASGVSILLGLGAGGVGNGTFGAPVSFSTTTAAKDVVVADFNADGRLDLACTNTTGIVVLLGNGAGVVGNGTFGAPTAYASGTAPLALLAEDFDADGIMDLAAVNVSSNNVSILLGNGLGGLGNGTFAGTVNYATGTTPLALATGDFNEDGTLDLAVTTANGDGNCVSVLIGVRANSQSTGTFAAVVNYVAPTSSPSIVTGDFDENGRTDLALGTSAGIAILSGNGSGTVGNGTFAAPVSYTGSITTRELAVCDLNSDGRPDILQASSSTLRAFLGNGAGTVGDGTFTTGGTVAVTGEASLLTGDFDENGSLDAAIPSQSSAIVNILSGGCAQTLPIGLAVTTPTPGTVHTIGPTRTMLVQWTKGDGVIAVDVELSRDGGLSWTRLANDLTGTSVTLAVNGPTTAQARLRVVDSAVPTRVGAMTGNFTICGGLSAADFYGGGVAPTGVAHADFNEDGIEDLAVANTGGVSILLGDGTAGAGDGTFGAPTTFNSMTDALGVEPADFNDDGITDLGFVRSSRMGIVLGQGSGDVGSGTLGASSSVLTLNALAAEILVRDFNEDGIPDVAALANAAASFYIATGRGTLGVGDGTLNAPVAYPLPGVAGDMDVGDLNEDGILDLAFSCASLNAVAVVRGNGAGGVADGTFAAAITYPAGTAPAALAVGEINFNGILDLIVPNSSGIVSVLSGNGVAGVGDGTFAAPVSFTGPASPIDVQVRDFNQDGFPDIAVLSGSPAGISLLEHAGSLALSATSFVLMETQIVPANTAGLTLGDFDENGRVDLAAPATANNRVAVLLGPCPGTGFPGYTNIVPDGGEQWLIGSNQTINWFNSTLSGPVSIDVSRDSGDNWETIAHDLIGPPFVWTVNGPVTLFARVRVRNSVIASTPGISPGDFAIVTSLSAVEPPAAPAVPMSEPVPNPSSASVRFDLDLKEPGLVRIDVFDVAGRRVATLAAENLAAGPHTVAWDGRLASGLTAPAGLYFVKGRLPGLSFTRRVVRVN